MEVLQATRSDKKLSSAAAKSARRARNQCVSIPRLQVQRSVDFNVSVSVAVAQVMQLIRITLEDCTSLR